MGTTCPTGCSWRRWTRCSTAKTRSCCSRAPTPLHSWPEDCLGMPSSSRHSQSTRYRLALKLGRVGNRTTSRCCWPPSPCDTPPPRQAAAVVRSVWSFSWPFLPCASRDKSTHASGKIGFEFKDQSQGENEKKTQPRPKLWQNAIRHAFLFAQL